MQLKIFNKSAKSVAFLFGFLLEWLSLPIPPSGTGHLNLFEPSGMMEAGPCNVGDGKLCLSQHSICWESGSHRGERAFPSGT